MSSRFACHPTSKSIYFHSCNNGDKLKYYSSFDLSFGSAKSWKVHMGDVVVFSSSEAPLTLNEINKFEPNHYNKTSKHWKVGLVVALCERSSPKSLSKHIKLQILEKILDTKFAKDDQIKREFRPWRKTETMSQLPHVLLSTRNIQDVMPSQMLPVKIEMMEKEVFMKEGVKIGSETPFDLKFYCPKLINAQDELENLEYSWDVLNASYKDKDERTIMPKPMQDAYKLVPECKTIMPLLSALIKIYQEAKTMKREAQKSQKREDKRLLMEKENLKIQQAKNSSSLTRNNTNRRTVVRIKVPSEDVEKPFPKKSTTGAKKSSLKQKNRRLSDATATTEEESSLSSLEQQAPTKKARKSTSLKSSGRKRARPKDNDSRVIVPSVDPLKRLSGKLYYDSISFKIDDQVFKKVPRRLTCNTFTVKVGQVIAIRTGQDDDSSRPPFDCPWAVAQVCSIYLKGKEWKVQARWFFRCEELAQEFQSQVQPCSEMSIIEGMQLDSVDLETVLPAIVTINEHQAAKGELPTIHLTCRHFLHLKKKGQVDLVQVENWSFERGLQLIPKSVAEKYRQEDDCSINDNSSLLCVLEEEKEPRRRKKVKKSLQVTPLTAEPLYQRWNCKFYDGVTLEINVQALMLFKPKTTASTVQVGHVVPIQVSGKKGKTPFSMPWRPAQIVSLYLDSSESWKCQVRWFDRFEDLLDGQKATLKRWNQPHVTFETEVYSHVPVEQILPGRIVVTSLLLESFGVKLSEATGLPWIPLYCRHILLDEEVDSSMDWINYDYTLPTKPPPLIRGLELDPVNRENKEWMAMLSRYYQRAIADRELTIEEQIMLKQFIPKALKEPAEPTIKFDPEMVAVIAVADMYSSPCGREFVKKVRLTLSVDVLAKPSNLAKRQRKHRFFECQVGDVVCYHNKKATVAKSWSPFSVEWSFGQILSIFRCEEQVSVEICKRYRHCELPLSVQKFAPACDVMESDSVEEIPASFLLGKANQLVKYSPPEYFYFQAKQQIQPCLVSSKRGLHLSQWARRLPLLAKKLSTLIEGEEPSIDVAGLLLTSSAAKQTKILGMELDSSGKQRYFVDVSLPVNRSKFLDGSLLYSQDKHWKVKVGDFVAVSSPQQMKDCGPFTESWSPAQVLAIVSTGNAKNSVESLGFEVRLLELLDQDGGKLPHLQALSENKIATLKSVDLLGPLLVGIRKALDWASASRNLPCVACLAASDSLLDLSKSLRLSNIYSSPQAVQNTLARIGAFSGKGVDDVDENTPDTEEERVWTSTKPYHKDVSQLRAYYKELCLVPEQPSLDASTNAASPVTIKMGDTVVVAFEGPMRYPYGCNWSVAEVVTIWNDFESLTELESDISSSYTVQVEIRWLYERHELQRQGRSLAISSSSSEDYPEVFETDHVQVLQAEDILSPATIKGDSDDFSEDTIDAHRFICRQFWSTSRKSLIPCGKSEGRQKRGWLYSRVLPMEAQEKYADRKAQPRLLTDPNSKNALSWRERMERVMGKFNLQDASRGAYERGETLIGREKELDQIMNFFRAAIRGETGQGGIRSSMFIAGSPGVGKTACVRAAITRLHQEQARGDLPAFHFISLNGMEVRHPCEAYGKFWESLTGQKHSGSHQAACEKLKKYFTTPKSGGKKQEESVSVLLLDEIDYLITENQVVMYDFFDWPKLASETVNGKRLVVVGISNTLNLAERLLPSVQSRLGSDDKCTFTSYELSETISILKNKIKKASPDMKIFEDDALLLAGKKIAGLSGDIRKAFQICRDAAELVLQKWESDEGKQDGQFPTVRISDVQKASRQSFNTGLTIAASFLTPFQALLLISLYSLYRSTGRENGGFDIKDIMIKMDAIAGASGEEQYLPAPNFSETIHLLNSLGELNLVKLKTDKSTLVSFRASRGGSGGAWPLASKAMTEDAFLRGLKNTPYKTLFDKNLPSLF